MTVALWGLSAVFVMLSALSGELNWGINGTDHTTVLNNLWFYKL